MTLLIIRVDVRMPPRSCMSVHRDVGRAVGVCQGSYRNVRYVCTCSSKGVMYWLHRPLRQILHITSCRHKATGLLSFSGPEEPMFKREGLPWFNIKISFGHDH